MHIVITRPKVDSFYLTEKLTKLEHVVTNMPVIKIEKLETITDKVVRIRLDELA